ncbi:uncharacterized protein KIAA2013 homolog [Acanthaster planci]|uniref:Uncharacterized protein KIAA2013 homolog n=1 Tax=Acanthaster planci TaxID=133434 RepID=A0A8B7ZAY1_ACAPL|nr:uncharacterized protein KIAA2013 homolog [Acanthaster planci]
MALSSITKRLSGVLATPRSRKLFFLTIFLLVMLGYVGPWVMHHNQTVKSTKGCLTLKLKELESDLTQVDAAVFHADSGEVHVDQVVPFVGNGNIGIVVNTFKSSGFLLKNEEQWLSVGMYHPLVTTRLSTMKYQSATVLHFRQAQVKQYQCYSVGQSCVFIKTNTLVHRFRPELMLQEIVVENNADQPVLLELSRTGPVKWKGSTTTAEMLTVDGKSREYMLTAGDLNVPSGTSRIVVTLVIAATALQKKTEVPAKSVHKVEVLTLVKYSAPVGASTPQLTAGLVDSVEEQLFKILKMDFQDLVREHRDAWSEQIWNSGLVQEPLAIPVRPRVPSEVQQQLSHISAVHVFNILTTTVVYYVMSSSQAPLLMPSSSLQRKKEVIGALQQPGSCFNGQPTLFDESLWRPVQTDKEMMELFSHWQHVLYKHGCHTLLSAGVTGIMQAMMLSFLAGQFTERELSFHADPLLFRSKSHLHNIFYNTTFLHIDINPSPGHEILISITSVQASGNKPTKLYACGAGCEGTPILLTSSMQKLPLKWTVPQTPFLYISHDPKHLDYLKTKIIHFKHLYDLDDRDVQPLVPVINSTDAHQGFQMPVFAWVIIIGLIVIFHMFLINLVYKEYCSGTSSSLSRPSEKTSKA